MQQIKILELFGGIGAPRCALRNLGIPIKSIDYVEIDERAVRSYNAMFEKDMSYKPQDVRGYDLKPDILIHGSPCQDFSIAGMQKGADEGSETKSSLMWETLRIIKNLGEWKPNIVIWENVKNVLSKHMRHSFDKYLQAMEEMGYTNSYEVLSAMDFGLPQKRERLFVVSKLSGKPFNFSAMQKKVPAPIETFYTEYGPQHIVTQPSMIRRIPAVRKDGRSGLNELYIIEKWCYTVTCRQDRSPNAGVIKVSEGYRYLTEKECWRLMGFSDEDFAAAEKANPSKPGKMNKVLYTQAGNSMPVPLLESLFAELFRESFYETNCHNH